MIFIKLYITLQLFLQFFLALIISFKKKAPKTLQHTLQFLRKVAERLGILDCNNEKKKTKKNCKILEGLFFIQD